MATTTLQKEYEKMVQLIEDDARMSDAQKYEIMFGKPYKDNNQDPWKGVVESIG